MKTSRSVCLLAGLATLLVSALWTGCRTRPIPQSPNVLVVTFDTVRADHFGCYGSPTAHTPNVDALAASGVVFEKCFTPVPITLPAHVSIMTGLYPHEHAIRNNGSYFVPQSVTTLAEVLYDKGYETAAFVSAYVLHSQFGLNQGFQVYDDTVRDSSAVVLIEERTADQTTDQVLRWLGQQRSRPFFLWVHLFDPHQAYMPPAQWANRFPNDPYSGEIAFADEQLGRLLQEVDLSRTLVVFSGDHGEALGEHGEKTHAYFAYDSTLHVPLVIRLAGGVRAGERRSDVVSLVDVFPTVLGHLDFTAPQTPSALDLLSEKKSDAPDRFVYFETIYPLVFGWAPLSGLRNNTHKYIHAPRPELYAVQEDPQELVNRYDEERERAEDLKRRLGNLFVDLQQTDSQRDLSAEDRQKLASLGYVGGALTATDLDLMSLPDPKEALQHYLLYTEAGKENRAGRYSVAEEILRSLLTVYPDMPQAQMLLGEVLREQARFEEAMSVFERLLRSNPSDNSFWYAQAVTCNKAGLSQKAIEVCTEGLRHFPDEPGLLDQMGLAYKMAEDYKRAIEFGQRAVRIVPNKPEYLNNLGASYSAAGKYKEAQNFLSRAVSIQPDFSSALFNLGVVALREKHNGQAETYLRQAVAADETNHDAWVQLNKALLYQDKSDEALLISQKLLALNPEDSEPHYFMSVAYRQKLDFSSAEESLRRFLQANPNVGFAYAELCEVLLSHSPPKIQDAREAGEEAQKRGVALPEKLRTQMGR
ncbi:MAG TPA: sulfatase-like hydrolase/transferase [bacterium]|nr:sulfatase-like hydrolase/transferase [bacterium]